jgi:DUF1009 family protein
MLALIAGTGDLPIKACKSLIENKKKFFVITLFPENNLVQIKKTIDGSQTQIIQKPFYKTKIILDELKKQKTKEVLFIGKVDKQNLLKKFKLDWFAIKMLATLATKNDTTIMNKIGQVLAEHGMKVIDQDDVLPTLFVKPGILTGKLSKEIKENIEFGIDVAKKMSVHDVGQTVVVKNKMVLAVEAIEGTDECIQRGIKLGKGGVIICKTAQEKHDKKFDIPTIGPKTLENIKKGDVAAIAWQSNKTFIANQKALAKKARALGITLVST